MELETNANPHIGSGVRDAAEAIEALGLLEPSQDAPTEEQAPEETQANPEPEKVEEPVETEESEQSAETEAEPEPEQELPDTLDGLADAVGLTAEQFADHVKVPVTVNGQTEMVTLAEARKGYQLEADYRHKTTDLADQRRTLEVQQGQAMTEWQSRFQSQAELTQQLSEAVGAEEADLDRILHDDGYEVHYAAKQRVDKRKELLVHAKAEREQGLAHQSEQQRQAQVVYAQEHRNLLVKAIPDFADADKGPKLANRVRDSLSSAGFSEQEVATVVDSRMLIVAHKAMLYDDLQKAKPGTAKKLKGLPKVQKPGVKPEKGDAQRQKTAVKVQRLQRSGSRRDFAASILDDL